MVLTTKTVVLLDNAGEISRYARNALRNAEALGVLPTPIDDLLAAAKVGNLRIDEDVKERFLARLTGSVRYSFESLLQKVRGIADLRERVVYVDDVTSEPRMLFTKGHELGHEVLPWHRLDPGFFDGDHQLSIDAEDDFDIEANFFSSQLIFQVDRFRKMVREYAAGFDTIFHLAQLHGASRHATAWRYVEAQDEPIALLMYIPCKFYLGTLWHNQAIVSPLFRERYLSIDVPQRLFPDHAWAAACDSNLVIEDSISLRCGGAVLRFAWEAWWNQHTLLVLLRRKPTLSLIKTITEKLVVAGQR